MVWLWILGYLVSGFIGALLIKSYFNRRSIILFKSEYTDDGFDCILYAVITAIGPLGLVFGLYARFLNLNASVAEYKERIKKRQTVVGDAVMRYMLKWQECDEVKPIVCISNWRHGRVEVKRTKVPTNDGKDTVGVVYLECPVCRNIQGNFPKMLDILVENDPLVRECDRG